MIIRTSKFIGIYKLKKKSIIDAPMMLQYTDLTLHTEETLDIVDNIHTRALYVIDLTHSTQCT